MLPLNLKKSLKLFTKNTKVSRKTLKTILISHELIFDVGTVEETKSVAFISIYDKSEYETVDLDIIKKTVRAFRETQASEEKDKTSQ